MKKFLTRCCPALFLLLFASGLAPAGDPPPSFQIVGLDGQKTVFTLEELQKMPQVEVKVTNNHTQAVEKYEGVRLAPLLVRAGTPILAKVEGPDMADYVVVEAMDGYKVVFSLAELQPEFQDHQVIVALTSGGKPLPEKHGPFQIIVPQDKVLSRCVRMVQSLRLQQSK